MKISKFLSRRGGVRFKMFKILLNKSTRRYALVSTNANYTRGGRKEGQHERKC